MSEQATASAEGGEAPAKAGPKGVVLIGALIGSLLVGAAAGLFAVGPVLARKAGYSVPSAGAEDGATGEEGAEHGDASAGDHGGEASKGGEGGGSGNLHLVDNLVLNPAGSGGSRFLMLSAAIEFSDAAYIEETKARDAEVRDIVLRVMGAKTVEELAEMSNREGIKHELADSLGTLFAPPKAKGKDKGKKPKAIQRIYFPQFVIQ